MRFATTFGFLLASITCAGANEAFDKLAGTVEMFAGASFCNRASETELLAVQQWVDREIANERLVAIWREAIDDRLEVLAGFTVYDCNALLAKYDSFDFASFLPPGAEDEAGDEAGQNGPLTADVLPQAQGSGITSLPKT